jgi:hypothetical protein
MPAQMSVDDMYQIEKLIINNNQNGNLTPEKFNLINEQAQWDYMRFLLGDYRKYQAGRPIPPVAWGMTAQVRESLTPFIQPPTTISVDPTTGLANNPPDYEMWDAMNWGIYKQRVKFIQQGRLFSHINSTINPVQRNPVFLSVYRGFEIYPATIGSVSLSYVRSPKPIRWAYTEDIYRRSVYNPALSSSPEWQRTDVLEIIARAMRMMGVNLQAGQVVQYAEQIKNQGQ